MKSNGGPRPVVKLSPAMGTGSHRRVAGGGGDGSRFCRSPRQPYGGGDSDGTDSDSQRQQQQQRRLEQYQQRAPLAHKSQQRLPLGGQLHQPEGQRDQQLHVVAKPKLIPRFTRFQVLRIIKLATMDKLRDSSASGADDPTRQRLATEGAGGAAGGDGGKGGGRGAGGEGGSDEFHHQFYNTGRIGRRNALPDILGTHCTTTTADLSSQLGALSTSECAGKPADVSGVLGSSIAPPPNSGQTPATTTGT